MSHQERVTRWQSMIEVVRDRDVSWWAAAFLKALVAQHEVTAQTAEHNAMLAAKGSN